LPQYGSLQGQLAASPPSERAGRQHVSSAACTQTSHRQHLHMSQTL
jgi:hypothetical protein